MVSVWQNWFWGSCSTTDDLLDLDQPSQPLWPPVSSSPQQFRMAPAHCQGWCEDEMRKCNDCALVQFSSVQSLSCVQLFATPWTAAYQATLSITNSSSLFKLMSFELVMLSNHLILCHPLLFLPSIFPSIRVFSYESVLCIRWPKYWSFSFSINPSKEYSGLISFRIDWFDLLAVKGTLCQLGPS